MSNSIAFFYSQFDFDTIIKAFFLAADHRFAIIHDDLPFMINVGDIPVFDMEGVTYRHLTKVTLSSLRCYMKFTQEAFPVRLQEIHLINVSPILSKLLTLLKPFMKSSVKNMLNYHLPNSSTFHESIDKDLMPIEYGGKAGRVQDIKNDFIKQIESQRWGEIHENNFYLSFLKFQEFFNVFKNFKKFNF